MLNSLLTIVLTILIFGMLIAIHELGHYLVARAFGVGIIEFSIGMGPKIYSKEGKYNDFSVRALPVGGFVSMVGEYSDEIEEKHRDKPTLDSFSAFKRLLIAISGPAMNILLAFLIMTIYVIATPVLASTIVAGERSGESFENTSFDGGLAEGDEIIRVGSHNIHVYSDLSYEISAHGTEPLDITVLRNGKAVTLSGVVFPTEDDNGTTFGVMDFTVYRKDKTVGSVLHDAFFQPVSIVYMTLSSLSDTFSGRYGFGEAVGGPIAIGGAVGDTISEGTNFWETVGNLAVLTVFISVSLGICNLLPVPVLDGGMILFCLIELIFRKPVPKKIREVVTNACAILLIALMVVICVKDVIGLF